MKYVLDSVNMPEDIKKLNIGQLNRLALELRSFVLENVSKTGGHLASNRGIVELTLAVHDFFYAREEEILWGVLLLAEFD